MFDFESIVLYCIVLFCFVLLSWQSSIGTLVIGDVTFTLDSSLAAGEV